jgi:hypothetical protein
LSRHPPTCPFPANARVCYNCLTSEDGHISRHCPNERRESYSSDPPIKKAKVNSVNDDGDRDDGSVTNSVHSSSAGHGGVTHSEQWDSDSDGDDTQPRSNAVWRSGGRVNMLVRVTEEEDTSGPPAMSGEAAFASCELWDDSDDETNDDESAVRAGPPTLPAVCVAGESAVCAGPPTLPAVCVAGPPTVCVDQSAARAPPATLTIDQSARRARTSVNLA